MRVQKRSFMATLLAFPIIVATLFAGVSAGVVTANAAGAGAYQTLITDIYQGQPAMNDPSSPYYYKFSSTDNGFATKTYKKTGGDFVAWGDLTKQDTSAPINVAQFQNLTKGEKRNFIEDVLTIANADVWTTDHDSSLGTVNLADEGEVTDETVQTLVDWMSQNLGMGGTLIASLLQNTKPDFVSANRIYAPFSGIVGTILGLISILIIALLGIHMALDIAYIMIPSFYMIMGGGGEGGEKSFGSKLISKAAKNAMKSQENDGGSNGQGGGKQAIAIYLKSQIVGLIVLGIALLYLVSGNIYSLVGSIIDLVSGFLGF